MASLLKPAKRFAKVALGPLVRNVRSRGRVGPHLTPDIWGLGVSPDGQLAAGALALPALRERFGSPLHVVLADKLRRNAASFQKYQRDPTAPVDVFYSYKTNPVPGVLRLLHGLGIGAEAISEFELWLAFQLGVAPDRIIYNGPAKSPGSVRAAIERDILLINANHREEVGTLARVARELGKKPRVGIRVASSFGWAGQFGTSIATGEALAAFRDARDCRALEVVGLHAHLGGMVRDADRVHAFVGEMLSFADTVQRELGIDLRFLDFGGSLGTPTVAPISEVEQRMNRALEVDLVPPDPSSMVAIEDYVSLIRERVLAHFASRGRAAPRVILEPGRAMTANAQVLLTSVHALKGVDAQPVWAVLDAGINLAECVKGEYHHVFAATRMLEKDGRRYRLAGPICSPGDVLRWCVSLPPLVEGDALAIMDAGAYFVPFSTSFSFPQPAVVLVDGGEATLLRRAETFEDIVRRDVRP